MADTLWTGTLRRAPEGFAHAILLEQFGDPQRWKVIDAYGPMETATDSEVEDWPVVYVPIPDEVWASMRQQPAHQSDQQTETD